MSTRSDDKSAKDIKIEYQDEVERIELPSRFIDFIRTINVDLGIVPSITIFKYNEIGPIGEFAGDGEIRLYCGDDPNMTRDFTYWCETYAHEARHMYQEVTDFDILFEDYEPFKLTWNALIEYERMRNPNVWSKRKILDIVKEKYHGIEPDEVDAEIYAKVMVSNYVNR